MAQIHFARISASWRSKRHWQTAEHLFCRTIQNIVIYVLGISNSVSHNIITCCTSMLRYFACLDCGLNGMEYRKQLGVLCGVVSALSPCQQVCGESARDVAQQLPQHVHGRRPRHLHVEDHHRRRHRVAWCRGPTKSSRGECASVMLHVPETA